MNRTPTPGENDVLPAERGADRRAPLPGPTDTQMLDWLLPVIDDGGTGLSDKRVHALMAQLLLKVQGREAVRAAMESLGDV